MTRIFCPECDGDNSEQLTIGNILDPHLVTTTTVATQPERRRSAARRSAGIRSTISTTRRARTAANCQDRNPNEVRMAIPQLV